MTDTGWGGDPGHSGAKPMMHLKGGMASPNTQMPMMSENHNDGRVAANGMSEGMAPTSTIINSSGGDTPNRGTDSNGHRSRPNPA